MGTPRFFIFFISSLCCLLAHYLLLLNLKDHAEAETESPHSFVIMTLAARFNVTFRLQVWDKKGNVKANENNIKVTISYNICVMYCVS